MRRFVAKLLIFLSPILILLGLVEHRLFLIPTGYGVKHAYLARNINNVQVFITGSSHAYHGIDPQLLGAPAFNLAYDNQDIYYDTRLVLKYLPAAHNVKLVIVPISYHSMKASLEAYRETWPLTCYYHRFWGISRVSSALKLEDYSLIALYGIPQTREFLWKGFPASLRLPIHEDGFAEPGGSDRAAVLDAREAVARHTAGLEARYVKQNRHYLEEVFAALEARRIHAVIITTPCFHTYYEIVNPENYRVMQDEIQTLCQAYGLKYHNYLKDPRFTIDDFVNSDHLSSSGVAKFGQILKDEVVSESIK